jgi:hypothetical protein
VRRIGSVRYLCLFGGGGTEFLGEIWSEREECASSGSILKC